MAKKISFFTDVATEKKEGRLVYPIAQLLRLQHNAPVNPPIQNRLVANNVQRLRAEDEGNPDEIKRAYMGV